MATPPKAPAVAERVHLGAPQVRARYSICQMTLDRWTAAGHCGFPMPVKIGRRRFRRVDELENWERTLPRQRAVAGRE